MSYELVTAAKLGTQYAMSDLLSKISEDVTNIVWHYLGSRYSNRIDTEDVVQEVLIQVARDIATCYAEDWKQFMCWVYYISRNTTYKAVDLIKLGKSSADRTQAIGDSWEAAGRTETADEILTNRETINEVLELAESISGSARQICEMLGNGDTPKEIADNLGIGLQEVYGTRRTLKELANKTGVYVTPNLASQRRVASVTQQNSAKRAMFKQWKVYADKVSLMDDSDEKCRLVKNLLRALDRVAEADRASLSEHIGLNRLTQVATSVTA